MYATTLSSMGCTPLLRYEVPHITGKKRQAMVPLRIVARISSAVGSSPMRNFSAMSSSSSQTASTILSWYSLA